MTAASGKDLKMLAAMGFVVGHLLQKGPGSASSRGRQETGYLALPAGQLLALPLPGRQWGLSQSPHFSCHKSNSCHTLPFLSSVHVTCPAEFGLEEVAKLAPPTKEWSDKQKKGVTSIKFGYSIDCQGSCVHMGIRGPTGVRPRLSQAKVLLGLPKTVHTTLGES